MLKTDTTFPIRAAEEHALDRRRLLKLGAASAVAACAGTWLARHPSRASQPPRTLHVPDVQALVPRTARSVATGPHDVLVARLADGTVTAFDRRCPHLGCPVVYAAERDRFECPCHHAAFDARTGAVLFGPPRRGLTPVEVRA